MCRVTDNHGIEHIGVTISVRKHEEKDAVLKTWTFIDGIILKIILNT
jgi:hypothetical protein